MATIGLKFCGGCNPGYDRVAYAVRVRQAAGRNVPWTVPDLGECSVLLLINGCERACAEAETAAPVPGLRIVSVKNETKTPEEIVFLLLEKEEGP